MVPSSPASETASVSHRRHPYGWITSYHVTIEPNVGRLLTCKMNVKTLSDSEKRARKKVIEPAKEGSSARAATAETGEEHASFQRFFPKAKQVCIAGSFNNWQPSAARMEPYGVGCGRWKLDLCLRPGRYEYRLVVDGQWVDDPLAHAFVPNPFGTRNCVLLVNASTPPADRSEGINP